MSDIHTVFEESWEGIRGIDFDPQTTHLVVSMDIADWPTRVALRAAAYALIAQGKEALGDEILQKIGKQG